MVKLMGNLPDLKKRAAYCTATGVNLTGSAAMCGVGYDYRGRLVSRWRGPDGS
jgi:hypothetical protein